LWKDGELKILLEEVGYKNKSKKAGNAFGFVPLDEVRSLVRKFFEENETVTQETEFGLSKKFCAGDDHTVSWTNINDASDIRRVKFRNYNFLFFTKYLRDE
jgi:hypothetical protein